MLYSWGNLLITPTFPGTSQAQPSEQQAEPDASCQDSPIVGPQGQPSHASFVPESPPRSTPEPLFDPEVQCVAETQQHPPSIEEKNDGDLPVPTLIDTGTRQAMESLGCTDLKSFNDLCCDASCSQDTNRHDKFREAQLLIEDQKLNRDRKLLGQKFVPSPVTPAQQKMKLCLRSEIVKDHSSVSFSLSKEKEAKKNLLSLANKFQGDNVSWTKHNLSEKRRENILFVNCLSKQASSLRKIINSCQDVKAMEELRCSLRKVYNKFGECVYKFLE